MTWQNYLEEHQSRFLEELLEFLSIPSISSLTEHQKDIEDAAQWVANRLELAGLENITTIPAGRHPVIYGQWLGTQDKPTVLIYGHYDTQPVDPIELWDSPPFEPIVKEGRVYARGASDDKGNMLAPILAIESLLKSEGKLPINVKVLFEGQEEIGSPELPDIVRGHKDLLACDLVISADGWQWAEDQPSLLHGLRGLCAMQVDVKGASTDLHSGSYGGTVQNPIHALVSSLAAMRGPDGKILIEGFYDDVLPLSQTDRENIAAIPFDEASYTAELGLEELFGEPDYSVLERVWTRPTLEVNGIWGGFQGEGVKTVLPNEAHAKISCRLVANQKSQKTANLVKNHIEGHFPIGASVTVTLDKSAAEPYLMPTSHPANQAASNVLQNLYGKTPFYTRTGGSIPFCGLMLEILDVYTLNFAFGLEDEGFHAPNEFFRLSSFKKSQQAYVMLLNELVTLPK